MKYAYRRLLYFLLILLVIGNEVVWCAAWDWTDFVSGGGSSSTTDTLTMAEVSTMRVRDIKRRLTRTHGYSAEEISKMLDKKELIQALAFEEYKEREIQLADMKRALLKQGILVAIIAIALVLFWPLLRHVWEVASVNFVVYTDRKKYEAKRCWELQSIGGLVGVTAMFLVDSLQIWLSASILLSWVMTSKYFFPTPSIPIRPAQFMKPGIANGPLGGYGINVGPMIISWLMRFVNGKLEYWTGKQLSKAQIRKKKETKKKREGETPEEKEARRAARRAARAARKAAAAEAAAASQNDNDKAAAEGDIWQQQQQDFQFDEKPSETEHDFGTSKSNGGMENYSSKWVEEMLQHQEAEDAATDGHENDQQDTTTTNHEKEEQDDYVVVTSVLDDLD